MGAILNFLFRSTTCLISRRPLSAHARPNKSDFQPISRGPLPSSYRVIGPDVIKRPTAVNRVIMRSTTKVRSSLPAVPETGRPPRRSSHHQLLPLGHESRPCLARCLSDAHPKRGIPARASQIMEGCKPDAGIAVACRWLYPPYILVLHPGSIVQSASVKCGQNTKTHRQQVDVGSHFAFGAHCGLVRRQNQAQNEQDEPRHVGPDRAGKELGRNEQQDAARHQKQA